ncbi:hypothetical protein CDO73_23800 [Saccharibacillus sp. O23]|uniref:DinB family protein n=1 Tax=Saccharibacillus sp. O23 TaxID=2009338 RepID=UPI000B4E1261|nr:DinB family protein [Saccharibacillus sp. O23]OWR27268.1 hypothetical protein CDO73_23800 [Saccharibacillus sp. O23]
MNTYLTPVFHQIKIAIDSVDEMLDQLSDADLESTPINGKRSYAELLSHIALICQADLLISNEATSTEMDLYYASNAPTTIAEIKKSLLANYNELVETFSRYSEEELFEQKKSYWGVEYTRFEWLLEILGHVYHHRGQLHTYISMDRKDVKVQLFE